MAPRRKLNKLLTCFYCGRRSTTRYDGSLQHFECDKCNATNYLDAVSSPSRLLSRRVRPGVEDEVKSRLTSHHRTATSPTLL